MEQIFFSKRVVPAMEAVRQGVFWLTGLPWRARELWLFNPVFLSTPPAIIISHPLIINLSHYCLYWLRKLAKNRVIVNTSRSLAMLLSWWEYPAKTLIANYFSCTNESEQCNAILKYIQKSCSNESPQLFDTWLTYDNIVTKGESSLVIRKCEMGRFSPSSSRNGRASHHQAVGSDWEKE